MRDAALAAFARPIAHRGLHIPGGPVENTLAAAAAASAAGYGIECDVQLSRDGCAVVIHDERLARLAGIDAAVSDLDAAALEALRLADGSGVPSLASLLALVAGRVPLVIEIKASQTRSDQRLTDAVLAEIGCYAGPVVVESFEPSIVARCARAACPVGLVGPLADGGGLDAAARLPRCDFLSWSVDRLGEAADRHRELPLTAWTVRTATQRAAAQACGAQIVFETIAP